MTRVAEIITDAFRELALLNERTHPTRLQFDRGLKRLQQVIGLTYGGDAGEVLNDWPLGNYGRNSLQTSVFNTDQLIRPIGNSRLIATAEMAQTVYFPVEPSDGSRMGILDPFNRLAAYPVTLDGNGRAIEGALTLLMDVNATNRIWFYRSDLGNWMRLTGLTATDEMPFPTEFDLLFTIKLAVRLSPIFEKQIPASTAAIIKDLQQQFVNRYLQSADLQVDPSLAYGRSRQSYSEFGANWGGSGYFQRGGGWW